MVRVDRWVKALCVFFLALACLLLIPSRSFAQNVAVAEVSGQILDPTGASVPDAKVDMIEVDRNIDHTTMADDDGRYLYPNLPVGPYKLTVEKTSFKTYVQTGIVLQVNDHVAINVTMQLGSVTESVTVQAGAVMVQTDTAAVSNVINQKQITDLPLNGRFASELITISGLTSPYQQSTAGSGYGDLTGSKSFFSSFAVSVAGSQYNGVNYLLDGGMNNDTYAFVNLPFPFPDALQEFSVETDALPAQTGTKAGGVVNVVTKSGTNSFHGDIFEFLRNGDFNARAHPYFNGPVPGSTLATNCQGFNPSNIAQTVATSGAATAIADGALTGNPCDILHRNQFGGDAGGKFITNKLFWFTGYQGTRIAQITGTTTNEPTQDEIADGDLAPYLNDLQTASNPMGNPTNYWAGVPNCLIGKNASSGLSTSLSTPTPYFGGASTSVDAGVDPTDLQDRLQMGQSFDPIAVKLFTDGYVPYGPGQGTNPSAANYNPCGYLVYSVPLVENEDQVVGKIDFVVSPKQTLFGRYFIDDFDDPDPLTLSGTTNLLLSGTPGEFQRAQSFTLGDTYTFSPTTINTLHLTWNRRRDNRNVPIPTSLSQLGASTYTETNQFLLITGPFSVGCGTCNYGHFNVNSWQVSDDIDLIRGRNHLTMGFDWIHTQDNTLSNYDNDGTLGFGTSFTGSALGDYLMGAWSSYSESRPQQVAFRAQFPAVYFQDVLRVNKDLTINAGLRWEPELFPYDTQGRGATFNLQAFIENQRSPSYAAQCTSAALAIDPNACPPAGFFFDGDPGQGKAYSSSKILELAPRLGIAWNPFGSQKQVVRVGGGIFFDDAAVWWSQRLTSDPPGIDEIDLTQSLSNLSAGTFCGTLSQPWEYFYPAGCEGSPTPANLNGGGNAHPTSYQGPFPAVHDFPSGALWVVIPPSVKPTYVGEWTASYQYQFGGNWVVTVSYLGNKSTHLPLGYSINFSETPNESVGVVPSAVACNIPSSATASSTWCSNGNEQIRRYLNILAGCTTSTCTNDGVNELSGQMEMGTDSNNANYNAMLATVQHRFSHGFTWNANYTYSHCFDYGEAAGDLNGNTFYQNQLNFAGNYGSCTFDIRNMFNTSVVASTALKHGWKGNLLGGWQVAPSIRVISGPPVNFTIGDASLTGGSAQGTFEDFVPGCSAGGAYNYNGLQNGYSWFNQSCFLESAYTNTKATASELVNPVYTNTAICAPTTGSACTAGQVITEVSSAGTGSGQFGLIQRNFLRAPGAINFDMSISRMFPIHENITAEFQFEAFNVFNHWNPVAPSGGSPTGTTGSQTFGYITSAPLSNIIPTAYDPRVLQFALKFHW
jgi:carboxypeptidase family protein